MLPYRNQGGFHIIGAGREKITKPEPFVKARAVIKEKRLVTKYGHFDCHYVATAISRTDVTDRIWHHRATPSIIPTR